MFKCRKDLENIYSDLVKYALVSFKCEDVMTFMGRKMHPAFSGEVVSDIKKRPQGIRIKHRMKTSMASPMLLFVDICSLILITIIRKFGIRLLG
jgi:hypothetical protein